MRPFQTILLLSLTLLAPAAASPQTTAAAPGGFVGSVTCRTCHPDVWQNFYKNPHYKSVASGKEPPDKTGCEGCHGAGPPTWRRAAARPLFPTRFL